MSYSESQAQAQELARTLKQIADELRGQMDAGKFKNYILGIIFFRYLSERTEKYMDEILVDDGVSYREALAMEDLREAVIDMSYDHLGYVLLPENMFSTIVEGIKAKTFSIEQLEKSIDALVKSTVGKKSEPAFDKLFDDMNLQDKDLGKEVSARTDRMSKVILRINALSFDTDNAELDILGTAYMYLISEFAADSGKLAGEFFTPVGPAECLARLGTLGLEKIHYACDCAAGSGSLLLRAKEYIKDHEIDHYYAQELNGSTYNLLRMNFLMHGIPYHEFTAFNDDTLKNDNFYENGKPILFSLQLANPPFSLDYDWSNLTNDPRYSSAGCMPPNLYADWGFVEHMVHHMAEDGKIAVILPLGALYRNTETKIRKYLIDKLNVIDGIVALPVNLFNNTSIPVCITILRKNRNGDSGNIFFIDAGKEFSKGKNTNELLPEHINKIVNTYADRKEVEKFASVISLEEIKENDYNLNVSRYVDTFEAEESVDINVETKRLNVLEKTSAVLKSELSVYFKELGLEV